MRGVAEPDFVVETPPAFHLAVLHRLLLLPGTVTLPTRQTMLTVDANPINAINTACIPAASKGRNSPSPARQRNEMEGNAIGSGRKMPRLLECVHGMGLLV